MASPDKGSRTPLTCECCGATDGIEHEAVMGVAVDPDTMLCLYCQPCPQCHQTGTACTDQVCYSRTR